MKREIFDSRRAWIGFIIFFVLVAVSLVVINKHVIAEAQFELTDFAANSLLVQDAKSLKLVKGNYSRMGFNHPGPAILYVLAFGELVFYDWTRIAPSPFAGQLIAVAVYSAFWITLIGTIFYRFSNSLLGMCLLLAVFLSVSALSEYQVFAGIWFPHLYYFPFAVFTLALGRLACGHSDSILMLAISCGFLINGHVSFVPITGIMVGCALLANQVLSRKSRKGACLSWLSREALSTNGRKLVVSLTVLLLFLVPLLVETIVNFPGPLPKYVGHGVGGKKPSFIGSVGFVITYWGNDAISWIWSALSLGLVYVAAKYEEDCADIFGILSALFAATVGIFIYAKFGIDDLSHKYLGLFYYSVPAVAAAMSAYFLYRKIELPVRAVGAVTVIVVGVSLIYMRVKQPPEYMWAYNQPNIPILFQKMIFLGKLPLVLDLDDRKDFHHIWATLLGVQAYGTRMNIQLFCVNRMWSLSFTEKARCTEEQVRTASRYIVSKAKANMEPGLDYLGLSFYRAEPPLISGEQVWTVGDNKLIYANFLLGSGWSAVEEDFVWSVGKESRILLNIVPHSMRNLYLDLGAFLPKKDSFQRVAIRINDVSAANFAFTRERNRGMRMIKIPDNSGKHLELTLSVDRPSSPYDAKISGDKRRLGVALYGISTD
jgi:hypothetical protein